MGIFINISRIVEVVTRINGWVDGLDLETLIDYAGRVNNGIIFEIGTASGRSAATLAIASSTSKIYTLDNYEDWYYRNPQTMLLSKYQENNKRDVLRSWKWVDDVLQTDILQRITHIIDDSRTYEWTGPKFDLLFIDGNHAYKFVKNDYERFIPYVKKGGVVIMDDYTREEGNGYCVKKYLDEIGADVKGIGNLAIIQL